MHLYSPLSRAGIMLVFCALSACGHRGGGNAGGGPPGGGGFAMPVSAAPITRGSIAQTFNVTGTVSPLQQAALSSVASGTVLSVGPQIGQHVSKGELLVKIDDSTLRAQLQQNEAALESARARLAQTLANTSGTASSSNAGLKSALVAEQTAQANLRRTRQLFAQGYVSQSALDQQLQATAAADAALREAQVTAQNAGLNPSSSSAAVADVRNVRAAVSQSAAAVSIIQSQIAQTDVRAPFDGVVTARNVDPGALAAPGQTLMQVSQLSRVFVDVGISGENVSHVRVGTPATVSISGTTGRSWRGSVAYLSTAAAAGTLSYQARIPIANPDARLRGGMVVNVSFEQSRKSGVLLAPHGSVFQTEAGYSMFIIDGGKAKSVPVETGLSNDQVTEVSGAGLKPGVQAILNHAATLQPGMPVQPLPAQPKQAG